MNQKIRNLAGMKVITGFTLMYILLALREAEAQHRITSPEEDLIISWMDVQAVSPSGGRVILKGRRPDGSSWELVIAYDHQLKSEYNPFPGICPDVAGYRAAMPLQEVLYPAKPALPQSPYFACVQIRAPTHSAPRLNN